MPRPVPAAVPATPSPESCCASVHVDRLRLHLPATLAASAHGLGPSLGEALRDIRVDTGGAVSRLEPGRIRVVAGASAREISHAVACQIERALARRLR